MFRCFLTGVEVRPDSAYVLNRTVVYRLLRSLKERTETLERLLQQLGPHDETIVKQAAGQPPVTKKHRRLVSKAVAEVLRTGFQEQELFLPFTVQSAGSRGRPLSQLAGHPDFGRAVSSSSIARLEEAVRLARAVTRRLDPGQTLPEELVSALQAGVCLATSHREPGEVVRLLAAAVESDDACVAIGVPAALAGRFRAGLAPLLADLADREAAGPMR